MDTQTQNKFPLSTGDIELDAILGGGLTADRLYLVEGSPMFETSEIDVQQLDPGQLSPGEFAFLVREAVKPDSENRQATSVIKNRTGGHERTIREFRMANNSIVVGQPLCEFHGILSGTPQYLGGESALLRAEDNG